MYLLQWLLSNIIDPQLRESSSLRRTSGSSVGRGFGRDAIAGQQSKRKFKRPKAQLFNTLIP